MKRYLSRNPGDSGRSLSTHKVETRFAHRLAGALVMACVLPAAALAADGASDAPAMPVPGPVKEIAVSYPKAAVRPVTDDYFGTKIVDRFRWMENLKDPEVLAFAKAEDGLARSVLEKIPGRKKLLDRLVELDDAVPARVGAVARVDNGALFYELRAASDNQFKLVTRESPSAPEKVLVDPGALAKASGKPTAIDFFSPSPNGRYVAYGLSENGSEESTTHVMEVATGREIDAPIDRTHYSEASWTNDSSGFFYFRQRELAAGTPAAEKYQKMTAYYHKLGSSGADAAIVTAGAPGPFPVGAAEFPIVFAVRGTPYIIGIPNNGTQRENAAYLTTEKDMLEPNHPWKKLFSVEDDVTDFAIHGEDLYVVTHKNAPHFKVEKTRVENPDLAHATPVVPESDQIVNSVSVAKDAIYVQARRATLGRILRIGFANGAKPEALTLPFDGTVGLMGISPNLSGAIVALDGWTRDSTLYAYDPEKNQFSDTHLQPVNPFGHPDFLASKEVMATSDDGTQVPLSIVYPKDMKLDGQHPAILWGYGSYGVVDEPGFSPRLMAWYEQGGILATCHVRGGGLLGEQWYKAGYKATKPNTWKDFIACGEYLVKAGYTQSSHLSIWGGSAGGITIGRALTSRPDLFVAASPAVGALNTLRAETGSNGVPNIPEFGTVKVKEEFEALREMDSTQHVVPGTHYPAVLLTHGFYDPRVDFWESLKMTAALQSATVGDKPVLLRVDFAGGHGIGATKRQILEERADVFSFFLWQSGDPRYQPQ